jgi:hypothetical protein
MPASDGLATNLPLLRALAAPEMAHHRCTPAGSKPCWPNCKALAAHTDAPRFVGARIQATKNASTRRGRRARRRRSPCAPDAGRLVQFNVPLGETVAAGGESWCWKP